MLLCSRSETLNEGSNESLLADIERNKINQQNTPRAKTRCWEGRRRKRFIFIYISISISRVPRSRPSPKPLNNSTTAPRASLDFISWDKSLNLLRLAPSRLRTHLFFHLSRRCFHHRPTTNQRNGKMRNCRGLFSLSLASLTIIFLAKKWIQFTQPHLFFLHWAPRAPLEILNYALRMSSTLEWNKFLEGLPLTWVSMGRGAVFRCCVDLVANYYLICNRYVLNSSTV